MACQYLSDAINTARVKYNIEIWAYVFMPEHVHLLIFPKDENFSISEFLKSVKQSVSRNVIWFLKENFPEKLVYLKTGCGRTKYRFWQKGGAHDRIYWSSKGIIKQVDYIHNNPVKKGLSEKPGDWYWSSAGFWLAGERGPVVVERECFPLL